MTKKDKRKEDTDYTDEQGGGGVDHEQPLTKEELFEQLDKVIKADPTKKRQSPDEESSKT